MSWVEKNRKINNRGEMIIRDSRVYNGDIALKDVEKDQKKFKSDLGHIEQGPCVL